MKNNLPAKIEYHTSPKHSVNSRKAGKFTPCLICGKGIRNPDKAAWVHVVDGGGYILRPDLTWDDPLSDLGGQPIGADCLRQHPELKPYIIRRLPIDK